MSIYAAKFKNMIIARFTETRYLVSECKVFIKIKPSCEQSSEH